MAGILALSIPIVALLTLGLVMISRGPIGHAVARAISGSEDEVEGEVADLRRDVRQMRIEMGEMAERVEFAERLLAKMHEAERLRA